MNFEQWWENNVNLNNVEKKVSEVLWDFAGMAKEAAQAAWSAAQKNKEVEPSATDNTTKATIALLQEYFDISGVCENAGVDEYNCQCLTCRTEKLLEKIAQQ